MIFCPSIISTAVFAAVTILALAAIPDAGADEPVVKVSSVPLHSGRINPMLYGGFIELLDDLAPGMWAEMLGDRNFEGVLPASFWVYYTGAPSICDQDWDKSDTWSYDTENPFNGKQSARLTAKEGKNSVLTQSGLAVKKGMTYEFEGYFRADNPNLELIIRIKALDPYGNWATLGSAKLSSPTTQWAKQNCRITCSGMTDKAVFELIVTGSGNIWADKLSLMPSDNMKGWRPDVVQAVIDAKPEMIRWGGSVVDPGGYKWKNGIGDRDQRTPFKNSPWGRMDPNDVGLDEFLQFCEIVDVEPLICVSYADGPESARDMVNYCNGGSGTEWGRKRIENGHPEPYNVKYWQIGNELGGEEYARGCVAICKAIREVDPDAILLSSFPSPELFGIVGEYIDYVCPHHYEPDLEGEEADILANVEAIKNASLDHEVKLGITEWNITGGWWGYGRGRLMTLDTALFTGRYLNMLHRHSDAVGLACRSNMTNSHGSGMIQTNNAGLYFTPSYYVMKLYAQNSKPIPVNATTSIEGVDISACRSEDGKQLTVFAVNTTDKPIIIQLDTGNSYNPTSGEVVCDTQNRRQPDIMNHFSSPDRVKIVELTISGETITLPAYSVSAINCSAFDK